MCFSSWNCGIGLANGFLVLSRKLKESGLSQESYVKGEAFFKRDQTELRNSAAMASKGEGAAVSQHPPPLGDNPSIKSGAGTSRLGRAAFGFALLKGLRRKPMEDYHVAEFRPCADGTEVGLFSIFDGHAGHQVAEYLQSHLFNNILSHSLFDDNVPKAILEAYLATDKDVLERPGENEKWHGGSTATTAFLLEGGSRLVVANVGDSRAVLSRGGKAVEVSSDHDPGKPEEQHRVKAKGGMVTKWPGSDVYRVDAQLAVSRAFGDPSLKQHLSVDPDIWDNKLEPEDDFLIVSSDGLWHVMSSQDAIDLARPITNPESAARALADKAAQLGSSDDISIVVVRFG
eukprot:TRINITY_DN13493_c0_g1_i1.p1 TRINITY_DN13493_c0_g1~~TRINITY_DN13493_c0_g1_i1.p1  ORF type:complete len:344 (-),score=69.42 TRINITY_DN13493_c0_g1_i1:841-1872(-)